MKTIKTKPDCTLGFPLGWKDIDGRFTFQLNQDMEFPVNVIGKLSEVTEEQARELVEDQYSLTAHTYYLLYNDDKRLTKIALESLQSAALSVGIEEKDFDKFLVIKL